MSSKMVNQEYHVCPECDKSFKHLIPHLKNKHAWQMEDILNFNRKVYGSSEKETELHDVGNVEGAMDESQRHSRNMLRERSQKLSCKSYRWRPTRDEQSIKR